MADNKKSFILYFDLIHTVRKLPPDIAGKLFLTILQYVNDEDPVIDDFILDITFEPIKQQLIRDLKTWQDKKITLSENGKKGGRPRKANEDEEKQKKQLLFSESKKSLNVSVSASASASASVTGSANLSEIDNATKNTKQQNASHSAEIENPFGLAGKRMWEAWKDYKRDEHRKSYKSTKTEQQAIIQLFELSGGNPETASKIIQQSIGNQWQGLFELKNTNNGNQQPAKSLRESVKEEFKRRYPDSKHTID